MKSYSESFIEQVYAKLPKPVSGDFTWKCCGRAVPIIGDEYPDIKAPCPECVQELSYSGWGLGLFEAKKTHNNNWCVTSRMDDNGITARTEQYLPNIGKVLEFFNTTVKSRVSKVFAELTEKVEGYDQNLWKTARCFSPHTSDLHVIEI